jgi:hypothetical protein
MRERFSGKIFAGLLSLEDEYIFPAKFLAGQNLNTARVAAIALFYGF